MVRVVGGGGVGDPPPPLPPPPPPPPPLLALLCRPEAQCLPVENGGRRLVCQRMNTGSCKEAASFWGAVSFWAIERSAC